jgi:iron transport multicopper oxidase
VVDSIDIFAGQRYSFILNANRTADNYWIRAIPAGSTAFGGGLNSAILRYAGVQTADPTTTSDPTNPMLETNLHPLHNSGAPGQAIQGGADVVLNLNIGFNASSVSYSINGAKYVPPTVPVLLQILSGARSAHDLLPAGAVYPLPLNKVIEISIPGGAQDSPVRNAPRLFATATNECLPIYSIHSICMEYVFSKCYHNASIKPFPPA